MSKNNRQPAQNEINALINLYNANQLEKLENEAARLISKFPKTPILLLLRAVALTGLERLEDAIENYRRALAVQPDYLDALNNLGVVLKRMGRFEEAVECYQTALKTNPNHVDVLTNLGGLFTVT